MDSLTKRLEVLEKALKLIKTGIVTYKDLEISEGDIIKYNKHGQWSLSKEEPYWSQKSKINQQKANRESEVAARREPPKPPDTRNIKPSVNRKYAEIPDKKIEKEMGGGSLSGSYGMIS